MKTQSGSDFRVKLSDKLSEPVKKKMNEEFGKLTMAITEQMAEKMSKQKIPNGDFFAKIAKSRDSKKLNASTGSRLNKNAITGDQLKRYLTLYNPKPGHFDTPHSNGGNGSSVDIAVYQAPFDGSGYRWSFSSSGSNFYIDESSNRVYDADLGITANQIAVSLGVNAADDSTYFDCENVSMVLINHPMKTKGHVRVVGFIQCINDRDEVKILDHSQVFTWLGNEGIGYSETKDTHSLYLDINGENIGKNTFYSSDVIPTDTDDHDYTNLDDNLPAEVRALGIDIPVSFNQNDMIPLWIGTGTESGSQAVGQEIRVDTFQSWKLQEVWVITES